MTSSDNLAQARQAFDAWRTGRSGQHKIPHQLWQLAVALLDDHRISHVARELRLNQTQLRRQQLVFQLPAPIKAQTQAHTAFLEVPPFVQGGNNTAVEDYSTLLLRIERVDGHRLTLSLHASQADMVQSLVTTFLRS